MWLRACANKECSNYGRRWKHDFCKKCGNALKEIVQCCEKESVDDDGFCEYCGKKKEVKFPLEVSRVA